MSVLLYLCVCLCFCEDEFCEMVQMQSYDLFYFY